MKFIYLLLFSFFSLISTQSYAQNLIGKKKDLDQIMTNIKAFSRYYMNAQYDSLVNCYTQDGKIFPNNRKIIEGKKALMKYWVLPENIKILHHKISPEEIQIDGKFAYDYGYYEGKTLTAKNETITWKGKYVIVWKKVKGKWKIYLDSWNRVKDD